MKSRPVKLKDQVFISFQFTFLLVKPYDNGYVVGERNKGGKMSMPKVTEAEYLEATEGYMGWCPFCLEFTRPQTEPDAEGYDCPECKQNCVMGAEQALLLGEIILE